MSRSYTPGHVAAVAEFMLGLAGIDAEVTHRLNDLDFDATGHGFSLRLRWNSPTVSVVTVETPESVRICGLVGDAFGRSERLIAALTSERPENGQKEASPGPKGRRGPVDSSLVGWSPADEDRSPAAAWWAEYEATVRRARLVVRGDVYHSGDELKMARALLSVVDTLQ